MNVENIDALMIAMRTLYPVTFTDNSMPMWTERYRSGLSSLNGEQLSIAWNNLAATWKKRTAPTPSDILAAIPGKSANANFPGSAFTRAAFDAKQKKRDADRTEERRALIDRYERDHAPGYATAREQGWIGQLNEQVKRSANIIAQRNEQRRAGMKIPDWKPEFSEDNRSESFVPWCSIVTHEGVDLIEIDQGTLKVWRAQALIPGPGKMPIKQTAVQSIGFQSIETSSAA